MNRIKQLRKEKNFTLMELSEKINIPNNTLSQYENEKRNPKPEVWDKLAKFFGVSVKYLQGAYSKEEIAEIAYELFPWVDTLDSILDGSWDTVPMKWLIENPELNASEEDVKNIIRLYVC